MKTLYCLATQARFNSVRSISSPVDLMVKTGSKIGVYIVFLFLLISASSLHSQTIVKQGFESSGDTWVVPTFSTAPCTNGADRWDYSTSLSSITPSEGIQFWGIRDLNGNCGGAGFESITLPNVNVSTYTSVQFSFEYYVIGFDNGDDIKYEVFHDNVGQGEVLLVDGTSNYSTGGWLTETVSIPGSVTNVSVVLYVKQNGGGDYCGLDNVLLTGTPSASNPEIQLEQPILTNQACGFTHNYGTQSIGSNTDVTVRISNTGTADLTLTTPLIISGLDAGQYSIQTQPSSPISAGGFSDMVIRFSPSSGGTKTANIDILNNDADEGTCTVNLIGSAPEPEIQLELPVGTPQACGFAYDFGLQSISSNTDVTIRISNATGTAPLILTTPLIISGVDAGQYSIQTQPTSPIAAGGFSDMVVRFSPTSGGLKNAQIDIASNDADEASCTINLQGSVPTPDIQLEYILGVGHACGYTLDFGEQPLTTDTDITMHIRNAGTDVLTFATPLTVSGSSNFTIISQPTSPITAGNFSSMTIRFTPTSVGAINGAISISSNDPDRRSCLCC